MKDFYVPDLHELLEEAAGKFGDKTFIKYIQDYDIVEKSFRQVRDDSFALCRYFLFNSVCGKHIAIAGKTTYNFIIYFFAVLLSGNVAVPFSPDISTNDAIKLFDDADNTAAADKILINHADDRRGVLVNYQLVVIFVFFHIMKVFH